MIKDNVIINGYGTILIGANHDMTIYIQHIDPNAVIGENITKEFADNMTVLKEVKIRNLHDLLIKLKSVSKENLIFEHDSFIIDFSNYNEKSVEAWINQVRRAFSFMQLALAC